MRVEMRSDRMETVWFGNLVDCPAHLRLDEYPSYGLFMT